MLDLYATSPLDPETAKAVLESRFGHVSVLERATDCVDDLAEIALIGAIPLVAVGMFINPVGQATFVVGASSWLWKCYRSPDVPSGPRYHRGSVYVSPRQRARIHKMRDRVERRELENAVAKK